MAAVPLLPCPVRLGVVKDRGPAERLHKYTLEKNLHKMEKLLKKGVHVDSVNNLGQTPLFCASLLGLTTAVELLLRYGADPNHRCEDRSTPVHAAVFSCKPWLLSGVLDAGGDLRLHDRKGHVPQDWAKAGAQEHSQRMLDFLKRCLSHMHSLSQPLQPEGHRRTPSSSKTLLRSPSLLELLRTGASDLHVNRKLSTKSALYDTVQCFGFGKLCVDRPRQPLGLLASLPLIVDRELGHADDEPMVTYTCESFIKMTNCSWEGCRVTVKELLSHGALQHGNHVDYLDLLIIEQEHCCQLYHPHLLQLLAVSMSPGLQHFRLVFERVHVGSLHTVLHHRQEQCPALQAEGVLSLLLQVSEALLYLHGRGLVMRSLSSHAVLIVHPGVAKLTGLGFTVPSSESGGPGGRSPLPLPQGLYNWAAPEAIRNAACTGKADLYSLCALIQELFTDAVPWGPVDPRWIRQTVESGQALAADQSIPQPYYQLVMAGLQPSAPDRSSSLQDLRYQLRCDLRELAQNGGCRGSGLCSETAGTRGWGLETVQSRVEGQTEAGSAPIRDKDVGPCARQSDSMVAREIEAQLYQLDQLLDGQEDRALTSSDQSSLQTSFRESLSVDDCRLSLSDPLPEDGSQDSASESSAPPGGPGWAEPQGAAEAEPGCREAEHIGSVVLNLKVSQVLLQQSESSLRAAEVALGGGGGRGGGGGMDEVDGARADRPGGGWTEGGREAFSGALSARILPRATGPPSRSYLPCSGGHPGGGALLLDPDEDPSFYSSAQEESFVDAHPRHSQAERSCVSAGGTERRGQQPVRREGPEERTYVLSSSTYSPCGTPQLGWADHSTTAKWTSEVSEAVARMTRGRFGAAPCPTSSDSEEADRRMWAGRQEPLGHTDPRRPLGELQEPDSGHSSADMEQLFKSFAGIESESERDSDFHTVNRTFSMTCGVWEEASQREEEDTSDSDYAQSPEGRSSTFYTPNHELQLLPTGRCSQTPSSDGDLEVTMEVCQPAPNVAGGASETGWESQRAGPPPDHTAPVGLERSSQGPPPFERHAPVEKSSLTQAATDQRAPYYVASGLPDLAEIAELSSITCSPAQHQEWAGQAALRPSPLSGHPAPCNSTPRSPVGSPRVRPVDTHAEPLPHLPSLMDTIPWSHSPSQPLSSETFATATPGDSSTTEASASSVLQSPTWAAPPAKETGPPAGTPELTAAGGPRREAPGVALGSQDAVRPAGSGETARADKSADGGAPAHGGGGGAVVVTAGGRETAEGDSKRSSLRRRGVEISAQETLMPEDKTPGEDETPEGETLGRGGPGQDEGFGNLCQGRGSGPEAAAEVGGEGPGEVDRKRISSPDDQAAVEETQRAHSTLDDDLQGMMLEMTAGRRFVASPGAMERPRAQDRLRSEKTSRSGEDSVEAVVAEGTEASSLPRNLDHQEEKAETVNHESWSKPHRVIVLEQTPPKNLTESDQVLDK